MTRRDLLRTLAAAPVALGAASRLGATDARNRLGVCTYSYNLHWNAARGQHPNVRFKTPVEFLDYCHQLGSAGVQIVVGNWSPEETAKVRARAEATGQYVEGQVNLPRQAGDVERFDAQVRTAKAAGADVVRGVCMGGRRYEVFKAAEEFRRFQEQSWRALTLAEPVVRKHGVRLGIENHKDNRVPELVDLLKRLGSEWVGVCLDTGNSIALLEDPYAVVEALAPLTVTTHFKDMAVAESDDGFLLSEVPLGEGYLDLPRIVNTIRRAAPQARFNLEMITRDPLRIPCLTDRYWATLESVTGHQLARALANVRARAAKKPLPRTTGLSVDERLQAEDDNVRKCFRYAREHLGL